MLGIGGQQTTAFQCPHGTAADGVEQVVQLVADRASGAVKGGAATGEGIGTVQQQDVQVQDRAEALGQGDRAGAGAGSHGMSRVTNHKGREVALYHGQYGGKCLRIVEGGRTRKIQGFRPSVVTGKIKIIVYTSIKEPTTTQDARERSLHATLPSRRGPRSYYESLHVQVLNDTFSQRGRFIVLKQFDIILLASPKR